MWSIETKQEIGRISYNETDECNYVTISQDGRMLASGERIGSIQLINLETKFERTEFTDEIVEVMNVDRGIVTMYTGNKRVRLW